MYFFLKTVFITYIFELRKTKVMRISRQPSAVTIMIDEKYLENVERGWVAC